MVESRQYNLYFLEPNAQVLKPTNLWQNTGISRKDEGHGCPLACIYCNQQFLDTDNTTGEKLAGTIEFGIDGGVAVNDQIMIGPVVVMKADRKQIAHQLAESNYFSQEMAVIIRNLTDPGTNWKESIELARNVDQITGHTGPTVFITKWSVSDKDAREMKKYKEAGGKPIVLVTYSGLPKKIEPASVVQRINTMRKFNENKIPVVVSMRPMIEGINTDEETIRRVINETHEYATMYIVGGLYVYKDTPKLFESAGFPLGDLYIRDGYPVAKIIQPDLRQKVRGIALSVSKDIAVYDHASCATSAITTTIYGKPTHDPLPHWIVPTGLDFDNCSKFCFPQQMSVCKERVEAKDKVLKTARATLDRIGHADKDIAISEHQPNTLLIKDGILTFQELITIMRETGWRADNLPNREGMIYRLKQAFEKDLNTSIDKLKGLIQVGQQWYLFVDGKIDGTYNNVNTLRFSRSATRTRIPHTYDTQTIRGEKMIVDMARYMASESLRPNEIMRIKDEIYEIVN